MSKVLVSVICTNYNKGDWIGEAIKSFLSQKTNFKYEIILIDDASTDHSTDIIRSYANKNPEIIRAFYNKKNLGITKTWIKICKEAKGKYIARCDGDDYWIDNKKLQKQVDLLESSSDSLWCSTDYDIISPEGETTHRAAVETGFINRPSSYAEMLTSKGMTMASTWLVDAGLMGSINSELDISAVDDTFNIQLDLFNKTKLVYLPDATVVYRMNEGSDSRPIDIDAAKQRDMGLLEAQLEYIEKFKNVDYVDIIKRLLSQGPVCDERLRLVHRQRKLIESQEKVLLEKEKTIQEKEKTIQEKDRQVIDTLNSKRYKIGKMVTSPVSVVKSVLKKGKQNDR